MGFGYKGLVFCRNNGWLMENMEKGLTLPKWMLINWPKIPQFVCPKVFEKKLSLGVRSPCHWSSWGRWRRTFICECCIIFWQQDRGLPENYCNLENNYLHLYLVSLLWKLGLQRKAFFPSIKISRWYLPKIVHSELKGKMFVSR